jgi:hypothetical protein
MHGERPASDEERYLEQMTDCGCRDNGHGSKSVTTVRNQHSFNGVVESEKRVHTNWQPPAA